MTENTTSFAPGTPITKVASYDLPQYITEPSTTLSGFLQDYYASMINPTTGLINGYQQPRVAATDPLQQQALNTVPDAVGAWGTLFGQGTNLMGQAGSRMSALSTYDPAQMQQHLSPYLSGVLSEISRLGNENLTENVLPGINSTFTGAGQFGSTRNADFTQRAMRNNQREISGAQAGAMNTAYGQAANDYLGWNNAGQSAATGMAGIGQNTAQTALSGGVQNWNDISNAMNMGGANRAINQEGLTAGYEDWMNSWKQPMEAAGNMGGILSQLKQGVQPTQYQASTISTNPNAAWYALLSQVLTGS